MKLRFDVNQAETFRRGIDVPKSIVTIDVNPADLSQKERDLIADRLVGIDVCRLAPVVDSVPDGNPLSDRNAKAPRVMAKLATFESLMEAIAEDAHDAQEFNKGIEEVQKLQESKAKAAKAAKDKSEALLNRLYPLPAQSVGRSD